MFFVVPEMGTGNAKKNRKIWSDRDGMVTLWDVWETPNL